MQITCVPIFAVVSKNDPPQAKEIGNSSWCKKLMVAFDEVPTRVNLYRGQQWNYMHENLSDLVSCRGGRSKHGPLQIHQYFRGI